MPAQKLSEVTSNDQSENITSPLENVSLGWSIVIHAKLTANKRNGEKTKSQRLNEILPKRNVTAIVKTK